ncbi:MAG: SAM-dependent methyltransferase [Oscillospiraceae bacterium]|nr:SAM-dependent methyltransferase [Oscillospiraceae bacterium]
MIRFPVLDYRLAACADMVTGGFVCDIGTDHAYLPSYLVRTGRCERAIAADINTAPLEAARHTLAAEGTSDKVQTVLSDGLKEVCLDGVTDRVFAGMGGELIARLITEDERTKADIALITQPMTKAEILRRTLMQAGYSLEAERAVQTSGRLYTVMRWRYTGDNRICDDVCAYTGLLDGKVPADRGYMLLQAKRLESAAAGMKNASPDKADELFTTAAMIRKKAGYDDTPHSGLCE